ncbi:MAG TPA: hypothetical protein VEO02_06750 [Thermoanaerobaculia bacterium]|nr:hypothetical protein [Thermoanaerobaculia bacterium]
MSKKLLRTRVLLACALAAATPAFAQSKKPAKKEKPAAPAAPPKVQIAVESLMDRRTTGDFPRAALTVNLTLEGEDARAVMSARPRVTSALDDTGKSLAADSSLQSSDSWQQAREDAPLTVRLELTSPSRKAKTLASLEGVLETYLPSRDPASTVKVERVLTTRDKPLTVPALAGLGVKIQVLSKAGLEKEKKQAEAKKKAQAAKKKGTKGETEGLEGMADAMADAFGSMIERLFLSAGENDLIVKVDDPGKKIFSFDLAASDGTPIRSYGTMDLDNYRIVRMLEPIPEGASLQVRLKTPRSFGEVPFTLANVKLP